jgi:molybdenum cofactor guanylyltransferase
MSSQLNYSAIILAGGQNKRFGGFDKAMVRVFGKRMVDRVIGELQKLFPEIILVTNFPEKFSDYSGIKIISDVIKKAGPLGGLHAALKIITGDAVFLVSCDMPFIHHEIIKGQILEFEKSGRKVLIPRHGEFMEPMHAFISTGLSSELDEYLAHSGKRKLLDFLLQQEPAIWTPDIQIDSKNPFTNINFYYELENSGLFGKVAVLGFGCDVQEANLEIAREIGKSLAISGWGVVVGNSEGTFRSVSIAAIQEGGLAKIIYSEEDIAGDLGNWPLKEELPDVKSKRKRIAEISDCALVIGGGEGTAELIYEFTALKKKVFILIGSGGITDQLFPAAVYVNSIGEAIDRIKTSSQAS